MICTAQRRQKMEKGEIGGGYLTGMRENVCIHGFVGKGSYLEELDIDGTKILKLTFQKQFVLEFFN